jgi:hypothetical protein
VKPSHRLPLTELFLLGLWVCSCGGNARTGSSRADRGDGGAQDSGIRSPAERDAYRSPTCGEQGVAIGTRCLTMLTCCWSPTAFAVDAESFYWATSSGDLYKTPLAGLKWNTTTANADSLGLERAYRPFGLAIDRTDAYFTAFQEGVKKISLQGGTPKEVVKDDLSAGSIATDGVRVYWTNGIYGGAVKSAPVSGGTAATLASDEAYPTELAVDATFLYWIASGSPRGKGTVKRVATEGGPIEILAENQSDPTDVAIDGSNVYWTNHGDGTVMKVSLTGGEPVTVASNQQLPSSIAVDATSIYWSNAATSFGAQDGSVLRVAIEGGEPEVLVASQANPESLRVDATSVYWINSGPGNAWGTDAIMKFSPK